MKNQALFDKNFYKQPFLFGKSNKEISHLLRSIAAAYLLKNENKFKVIAYQNAADAVEHLSQEIIDIYEAGKIHQIPRIGPSIASHLEEYFKKGYSDHFADVLDGIPFTVFELMKVRSIGPKKAFKIVTSLKLFNPETIFSDVINAAKNGLIQRLEGFGPQSEKEILKAVEHYLKHKDKSERMILPYADNLAKQILSYLKKSGLVEKAEVLGSLRRRAETIGDIDIAVTSDKPVELIKYFVNYPKRIKIENAGSNKASIILPGDIRVDLRVIDKERFGTMLQYFTGSKAHNIKLREYALEKGYSISEYSIKRLKDRKEFLFSEEEDVYEFLGLQYIPPEIREGENEIEIALKRKIPKLIEHDYIKGDFHVHSNFIRKSSHDEGADSIEDLCKEAMKRGYLYLGISDHNPAFNLSEKEILEILRTRKEKIDEINSSKKFERLFIFNGLEVDILPDGNLALPDKAFDYLDYVIVSVHSSFNQPKDQVTKRVLKALNYPKVKIFGHPTGRLINKRDGIDPDWDTVFQICSQKQIALEINSWPERLDLPDFLIKQARKYNCFFVIDTDSHAVSHLKNIVYGVDIARRGWLTADYVANTFDLDKIKQWLKA